VSKYHPLTESEAIQYVMSIKQVFPAPLASCVSREIGDGNLNLVFHISEPASGKSVIVKQALPYAKVVGESWPLTLDRARIESEALQRQARYCPDLVPHVYAVDADLAITVMEDLSDHIIMRKGLMEQQRYPLFARDISRFLAHTLFFTSDLGMNQQEKKLLMGSFINPELCKITEDLIFDHPYWNAETNNFEDHLQQDVEAIWNDTALHVEVAHLRQSFLTHSQALLHGDLHTGSIFIKPDSTKVIDPEFAFFGPMGFDIAAILANLLLNVAGQEGLCADAKARESYRDYLLQMIEEIWSQFDQQFRQLWKDHCGDKMLNTPGYVDLYMQSVLQDTLGFAGAKMIRRTIGLAHVADVYEIADQVAREKAQRMALCIGKELIMNHRQATGIGKITNIARQVLQA
jgi:5-methylthioribose kinase